MIRVCGNRLTLTWCGVSVLFSLVIQVGYNYSFYYSCDVFRHNIGSPISWCSWLLPQSWGAPVMLKRAYRKAICCLLWSNKGLKRNILKTPPLLVGGKRGLCLDRRLMRLGGWCRSWWSMCVSQSMAVHWLENNGLSIRGVIGWLVTHQWAVIGGNIDHRYKKWDIIELFFVPLVNLSWIVFDVFGLVFVALSETRHWGPSSTPWLRQPALLSGSELMVTGNAGSTHHFPGRQGFVLTIGIWTRGFEMPGCI